MTRRRSTGPTLSLLAFQDIIVSVTGILLLVTLLLALELTRPSGAAATSTDPEIVHDLRNAIDRLARERESLRDEIGAGSERLETAAAVSPEELGRRLGEANLELDRQRRANEEKARRLAEAEHELERTEAALFNHGDMLRELAALEEEIANLEREAELAVRIVGRLSDRAGWRAELTGTAVRVVPMEIDAAAPSFPEAPSPMAEPGRDTASRSFLAWVAGGAARRSYLLLAVRPSGIARFDGIREELDRLGVSYGYEPIGEDQILADPDGD